MARAVGPRRAPRRSCAPVAARLYARYDEWIAEVVEEGIAAGEFRRRDAAAVVQRLIAAIDGVGLRVLVGDPAMAPARARWLIDGGLAASSAPRRRHSNERGT